MTTRPVGGGRLEATIRSESVPSAPSNSLRTLQVTRIENASVQVNGAGLTAGPTIALPASTTSLTLLVDRRAPAQNPNAASTVAFVVTDACGSWPSFVGGGPGAF